MKTTLLTSLLITFAVFLQGCVMFNRIDLFPSIPQDYQEVVIEDGSRDKILILDVDGAITSNPTSNPFDPFGVSESTIVTVAEKLNKAKDDRRIQAVILRVNSPGGGVTASDVILNDLKRFKQETGVPIYVSMLDLAASGGYYISMAADEIYAHPTTTTGSIGVIAILPQIEELGKKIGFRMEIFKSGPNKDLFNIFKDVPDEHRAILQSQIDQMYERFVEVVREGRPNLDEATIRRLADGRIYSAQEAEANGLIDGILYLDDLIEIVRYKHAPDARVVLYRKTRRDSYGTAYANINPMLPSAHTGQTQINNFSLLNSAQEHPSHPKPVFHYLWVP